MVTAAAAAAGARLDEDVADVEDAHRADLEHGEAHLHPPLPVNLPPLGCLHTVPVKLRSVG